MQWYPKAASTAFTANTLVYFNTTGEVIPADSTSGDHVGIIMKTVASTDSDYASETRVPIDVIRPDDIFEVDVVRKDREFGDVLDTAFGSAGN